MASGTLIGLHVALGGLTAVSCALQLWQWRLGQRFPVNQRRPVPSSLPAISVLKPLRGADDETERCLASWFLQDYPAPFQLLFAVESASDPAFKIVERLRKRFPNVEAKLLVCADPVGTNGKVSKLVALEDAALHEVVVASDADVEGPPDLLVQLAAHLADDDVGLVNCFYRLANASTPALRWEAIAINSDFWAQVLQSNALKPMDFALGAVTCLRRSDLAAVGGYEALADHLADDYQLGQRIVDQGRSVRICPVVVGCREPRQGWKEVWSHQLRWARTIRGCQPLPYFCSILSNVTLWSLLWIIATFPFGWGVAQALALFAIAARICSAITLHQRLSPETASWRDDWLVVVKDLLGAAIWAGAFLGNTVQWRGLRYRVVAGGELRPMDRSHRL
jgi:ceramide glucosyltransferase